MAERSHLRQKVAPASIRPPQQQLQMQSFPPQPNVQPQITLADVQAQYEHAQRFGPNLDKIALSRSQPALPPIQPKLTIGTLGNPSEQKSDRVAHSLIQQMPSSSPIAPRQQEQRPTSTDLPDRLKAGVESLSGFAMDQVKVHYNSPAPAQINALAYTQGSTIHVAPGQERHLPHEAWHVVQQAQGRVQPTLQLKGGLPLNAEAGLEREADVMGAKALQGQSAKRTSDADPAQPEQPHQPLVEIENAPPSGSQTQPVQRLWTTSAAVEEAISESNRSEEGLTNQILKAIESYETAFASHKGSSFASQAAHLRQPLETIQSLCNKWISAIGSNKEKIKERKGQQVLEGSVSPSAEK